MKQWKEMGLDIFVSINVSPVQLDKEDLAATVRTILKRHGITGESLILELTETPLMNNPENSIDRMNQIVEENTGIRLAVDDFGTGYSSLGYLSRFPVKILKIDRSFVMSLDAEGSNLKIIRSILSLGKSLDLDIVAEGVETEYQLQMLAKHGCDAFQGYYFSQAMPFDEVTEYIRDHRDYADSSPS
jgi:EAL domain-containing protein (putative c-di-GMP-specific phosphodiesterase class I)